MLDCAGQHQRFRVSAGIFEVSQHLNIVVVNGKLGSLILGFSWRVERQILDPSIDVQYTYKSMPHLLMLVRSCLAIGVHSDTTLHFTP